MVNAVSLLFFVSISTLNILAVWAVLFTPFVIQDSSVSTVTRLGPGWVRNRASLAGNILRLFPSQRFTHYLLPSSSPFGTGGNFLLTKVVGAWRWPHPSSPRVEKKVVKIFQKRRSHILGTRNMTWSNFHAEEPQILGAKVQNLFALGDLKPRICTPLVKDM